PGTAGQRHHHHRQPQPPHHDGEPAPGRGLRPPRLGQQAGGNPQRQVHGAGQHPLQPQRGGPGPGPAQDGAGSADRLDRPASQPEIEPNQFAHASGQSSGPSSSGAPASNSSAGPSGGSPGAPPGSVSGVRSIASLFAQAGAAP